MRATADFSGSPEECQEFLDRVKGTSLSELPLPGSTIACRRVIAVVDANIKWVSYNDDPTFNPEVCVTLDRDDPHLKEGLPLALMILERDGDDAKMVEREAGG